MTDKKKLLLKGLGTSAGIAEGRVYLVEGIKDNDKFSDGDILVTKITDPTMVMMMNRAVAIICDIGGITSHPSIIARELGIPCVVGTKEATTKLKNGQKIIVNGTTGEVFMA